MKKTRKHQKIAFRFDANYHIGGGHATRCLNLANTFIDWGHSCEFITTRAAYQFFPALSKFPRVNPKLNESYSSRWDLIVVDHYQLDYRHEENMRKSTDKIAVVDDLANRRHNADFLIDQTYGRLPVEYKELMPEHCKVLTGSQYALLSSEFFWKRSAAYLKRASTQSVNSILISVGASDPKDVAISALKLLAGLRFRGQIFIAGGAKPSLKLKSAISFYSKQLRVKLLPFCNLANEYLEVDLAIGASGVSTWERACLGLPAICVQTAKNQQLIFNNLKKVFPRECFILSKSSLSKLIHKKTLWKMASKINFSLCDGLGAKRVARILLQATGNLVHAQDSFIQVPLNVTRAKSAHQGWIYKTRTNNNATFAVKCKLDSDQIHVDVQLSKSQSYEHARLLSNVADWVFPYKLRLRQKQIVSDAALRWWRAKPKKIFLVVDNDSWILPYARRLTDQIVKRGHICELVRSDLAYDSADVVFFLGCMHLVPSWRLKKSRMNLVVHESSLPKGRGFSPLSWQIAAGAKNITVSLFEAVPNLDSGVIYTQQTLRFQGDELNPELRSAQGECTIGLCLDFIDGKNFPLGRQQTGEASCFKRRTPSHSRLDVNKSIHEQFNLMRVADNERYPLFFSMCGHDYIIHIEKKKV